jgi:hypothetical protein
MKNNIIQVGDLNKEIVKTIEEEKAMNKYLRYPTKEGRAFYITIKEYPPRLVDIIRCMQSADKIDDYMRVHNIKELQIDE